MPSIEPFIKGIVVPMITPFKPDLSVDLDSIDWLVNYLIEGGVDALFPNSTTGEFPHLRRSEAVELVKRVVEACGGRVKVLAGITGNYTEEVVSLGREFLDLGVDGFIMAPPYYFKLDRHDLLTHYGYVAMRLDAPIIIYNIPSTTGINIPVDVIKRLALEHSNIVGTKLTVDSLTYMRMVIEDVKGLRKDFTVLPGTTEYLLPALILGGDGGVLALANVVPKLLKSIYVAWVEGRVADAVRLYREAVRLSRVYYMAKSVTAGIKHALQAIGAPIKPVVRPPLTQEPPETVEEIRSLFRNYSLRRASP